MQSTLTSTQQHWNNTTLNYDIEKYNWPAWALSVIQEIAPQVTELETMHEVLSASEVVKVSRHVQNACSRKDFMQMFDEFVASFVPQKIDNKQYMIQRQGTLRVVLPNQASVGRRLMFHQGIWVGNGRGCRTIWTPFTEARGTNTMQIMPLEESRVLTQRVYKEQMSLDEFEQEALQHTFPVTLKPGQSHLFFQEHIHGNVNNVEGYTRVSMDMRVLIQGEDPGRRIPGGYFRLPGDYEAAIPGDYTDKLVHTYTGWNSDFCKGIPFPMQQSIIDKYCINNKMDYVDYKTENEHLDWLPSLRSYIKEQPDALVLLSIFALPDNKQWRDEILELAIENNVELHFANELLSLKSRDDLKRIQTYREFAL